MAVVTQWRDRRTKQPLELPQVSRSLNDDRSYDRQLSTFIPDAKLRKEVDAYSRKPRHGRSDSLTEEELARMREDNIEAGEEFRMYQQEELLDEKSRMGRPMRDVDFLARLQEIAPAAFVLGYGETSKGRYYVIGLRIWVPTDKGGSWCFISQVQTGVTPEFSIIRVDDHNVPSGFKYIGWRTVLLRAIIKGALSEEIVEKYFGDVTTGAPSRRYRAQLNGFRNRPRLEAFKD